MTTRPASRPPRKGDSTAYLRTATATGTLADQERELYAWQAWGDESVLQALAASVVITVILGGIVTRLQPLVFATQPPMRLHETRRPASWTERENRTTLVVIKCESPYHVWAESLAERFHCWDLLLGLPDARLVTQVVRLSWADASLSLSHYPDILWWQDDQRALIDVTCGRQLTPVQTLAWELTARLCDDLGWRYEVRVPTSRQRAKNLGAIDFCTDTTPATVELARRIAREMPERASLWRIVRVYQHEPASPLHAVLHLVGNGLLYFNLEEPLRASTWLTRTREDYEEPSPVVGRREWLSRLTARPLFAPGPYFADAASDGA